jgi:dihydroneopterin aldolase
MGKIALEGMEFFAYHGCFKEEQIIGTRFIVDLEMEYDSSRAEEHDRLHDALNYQEIFRVVRREMEQKSHLLEHVARRVLEALRSSFPGIVSMTIKISKMNPPLENKVRQVSFTLSQ